MKKMLIIICVILIVIILGTVVYINTTRETTSATMEYTNAVPSNYFNEASRQGRVERIEYQTYDYTQNDREEIIKTAYVYLPYEYDENDPEADNQQLSLPHRP